MAHQQSSGLYEELKLCADLQARELCCVIEQYREGKFVRTYHQHVPKSRLSDKEKTNLLRTLVVRFFGGSGMGADQILTTYLNSRGKNPSATPLHFHVTYPEPGVIRKYCGSNTVAWIDEVIVPKKFRQ